MPTMSAPLPTKRPGGLTALAILNIVFASLGLVIGGAGFHALYKDPELMKQQTAEYQRAMEDSQSDAAMAPEVAAVISRPLSPEAYKLMFALGVTGGLLLHLSAIGLLRRRRLLGKHVATASGLALMGCATVSIVKMPMLFWGVPAIGAIYAVVLLTLVHTLYRNTLQL